MQDILKMSDLRSRQINPRVRCRDTLPDQSCYHRLNCGHDVITSYFDKCAPNCVKRPPLNFVTDESKDEDISQEHFVCPTCLDTYTMAMAIEKKSEFGALSTEDHPDADTFNEMYTEGLEDDMKGLRDTVLKNMRPCRAANIHGEYGERVRAQRESMLRQVEGSMSHPRPRDDRSRSPASSNEGGDSHQTRSYRERSPPRARNTDRVRRAQFRPLRSHEIKSHLTSLMQNERRLLQLMQAMSLNEEESQSITQMMLDLKLEEDSAPRGLPSLSGETQETYMTKFLEWCKGAAPMEDAPVVNESAEMENNEQKVLEWPRGDPQLEYEEQEEDEEFSREDYIDFDDDGIQGQ